jgi:hypothetical protein
MKTVALTIDYSNGAQKHFSTIPWQKDLTILGLIQASEGIPPGATVTFGSDRSGHALELLIDEMPSGDPRTSDWIVSVNATPFESRLGTDTSFGFHPDERERNLLKPGDHVVVKLARPVEKQA